MSDSWMCFLPADRHYVPAAQARERTIRLLRTMVPGADELRETAGDEIRFVDCGSNWSGVRCPVCGADAEAWFADSMIRCYDESRFRELSAVAPCCGAAVSLDTMDFGWPVGFARFVLEARNPDMPKAELEPEQHRELERAVGRPLLVVWRHY